jgi:hypothetical protein
MERPFGSWIVVLAGAALVAYGAWRLWRLERDTAYLVACVIGTPIAAMLVARLGSSAAPETRHLIFTLPFFMLVLAFAIVTLARRRGRAILYFGVAAVVVAQVGWAYEKSPELFQGDPAARVAAREAAAR